MGQPIDIVAQTTMDSYYQNYRAASDFFTLSDFIFHVGATVSDAYQQEYKRQYDQYRQEGKDELASFEPTWLNEQILKVENKDGEMVATLIEPIMSFLYDRCSAGVQFVFTQKPTAGIELERLSLVEKWQSKFIPFSNKIYFTPQRDKITFTKTGNCNVSEVKVLYIPAISDKMEIPEGLVDFAITNTMQKMRAYKDGVIVKKSLNQNSNMIMESEIDKSQLK